jgi:hypothetical protein
LQKFLLQSNNAKVLITVPTVDESFNALTCSLALFTDGGKYQIGCLQGEAWAKGFPIDVPVAELQKLQEMPFGVTAWLPADEPMFRFSGAGEYVQLAVQKGGDMSKAMVRKADLQAALGQLFGTEGQGPQIRAS